MLIMGHDHKYDTQKLKRISSIRCSGSLRLKCVNLDKSFRSFSPEPP